MGMTMAEKILAKHAGVDEVKPGDLVVCDVDMAVQLDRSFATFVPNRISDPDKVAVVMDHTIPAPTVFDAELHEKSREFVKKFGVKRFYDIGNHGICHQVIIEEGLALPGELLACGDSHASASGALNVAARGLGSIEMIQVVCTGKTWFKSSPTIKVVLNGELPPGAFGKDVFFYIAAEIGSVEGHNLEFAGPGIASLSLDDRSTIATMCTEVSANFATFPADSVIMEHAEAVADRPFEPVESDPDAGYAAEHVIDLSGLGPYVAKPDYVPHNCVPVSELPDDIAIDQAFIGSCANGKLEDIRVAAAIVEGHHVADGVRMIVTPASQSVFLKAVELGYVSKLMEAGALVTHSTCGACYGGHTGVVGPGEVCLTSSTRNFKGRMGSEDAAIYMGSSATVAASAIAGRIVDPTPLLREKGAL
jgi:3-isopropylmalate/(R)-2-methylmalate dehydratase large subunit